MSNKYINVGDMVKHVNPYRWGDGSGIVTSMKWKVNAHTNEKHEVCKVQWFPVDRGSAWIEPVELVVVSGAVYNRE